MHPDGVALPNMIGFHTDEVVESYKKFTKTIHSYGAKVALQICHGGRSIFPSVLGSRTPIAPSAVKIQLTGVVAKEMTEDEYNQF